MTRDEFNPQMDRLKSTWPNSWPDEKVKLIWITVNIQEVKWFINLVNKLIANSRQAPLPADFIEAASIQDRKIYANGSDKFMTGAEESKLSAEESKEFFTHLKDVARGKYSKTQVKSIQEYMETVLHSRGVSVDPWRNEVEINDAMGFE